jgi:hypothetical protein
MARQWCYTVHSILLSNEPDAWQTAIAVSDRLYRCLPALVESRALRNTLFSCHSQPGQAPDTDAGPSAAAA